MFSGGPCGSPPLESGRYHRENGRTVASYWSDCNGVQVSRKRPLRPSPTVGSLCRQNDASVNKLVANRLQSQNCKVWHQPVCSGLLGYGTTCVQSSLWSRLFFPTNQMWLWAKQSINYQDHKPKKLKRTYTGSAVKEHSTMRICGGW